MAKSVVQNRVGEFRRNRGLTATDLAGRVEVSRQTIYAMEAGDVRSEYRSRAAAGEGVGGEC